MTDTPDVIKRYLFAADAKDNDELVACFTDDGTVIDEGETYVGHPAIRAWREGLASTYTYTVTVTGTEAEGEESFLVHAHIEGDFPGNEADLTYRFTLAGDLISGLVI